MLLGWFAPGALKRETPLSLQITLHGMVFVLLLECRMRQLITTNILGLH